jgi:hypothetical protein
MSEHTAAPVITNRTKVLILQHTYAITPSRNAIIALCRKHNIVVIEDLAHGWDVKQLQNSPYNTIKLFSFGRSKALSSIYGGAIATTGPLYERRLKGLERSLNTPSTMFILKALLYVQLSVLIKFLYTVGIGRWTIGKMLHAIMQLVKVIPDELSNKEKDLKWDDRMSLGYPNALAGLLLKSLLLFDQNNSIRLSSCSIYDSVFMPTFPYEAALSRYPIRVLDPDLMTKKLTKKNIYLGRWYRKVPGATSIANDQIPMTLEATEHIVNLPTLVTKEQAQKIADLVQNLSI